jgi:hypothetical protein
MDLRSRLLRLADPIQGLGGERRPSPAAACLGEPGSMRTAQPARFVGVGCCASSEPATNFLRNLRKLYGTYRLSGDAALAAEGL